MSGLVGIVGDAAASDAELDALGRAYEQLRGASVRHDARAAGLGAVIALGADAADDEPEHAADGSWVLCCGTAHDPERSGRVDVAKLDGQFVWVRYDAQREELQIANDPFGMRALYVAERDRAAYFSTSALALAKHLHARPSALGVSVYLRAGAHFGSRTNWDGIERLDPGTRVTFTRRGTHRETYWSPCIDERVAALDLDGAVEHCLRVATETYDSRYAGAPRTWADLTGGLDSRLMTVLLARSGVDFIANTIGDERSADVRIAARVARAAGWDWSRIDLPGDWRAVMPELVHFALAWGDGNLDALQLAEVLWGHLAKARLHPALLMGGGGELFRDWVWQTEFLNAGRSHEVNFDNFIDMRLLKPLNTSVFERDPTPEVRADVAARMRARAEPYSSYLNTTQLDIMHAYKSTGHHGAYLSAAAGVINAELPFFLKPVFTAATSTDQRHRRGRRLKRRMIAALDARVAEIETQAGGPAAPMTMRNCHRFLPYYAQLGRRAVSKLSQRALPRPILAPRPLYDPRRAAARAAFIASFDEGRPLRYDSMRCAPLFKRDALEDLLARAGVPGLGDAELLTRILTVELGLRAVDADLDDCAAGDLQQPPVSAS